MNTENEIYLFIGNIVGKLLTDHIVNLDSSLTAIEMKVVWTVFGRHFTHNDVFTILSLYARISYNLREHKTWMSYPIYTLKEKALLNELVAFKNKLKILPVSRYEVDLQKKHGFRFFFFFSMNYSPFFFSPFTNA